jgi:hypothetical protein
MTGDLKLRCPCGARVAPAPLMLAATTQVRRTCRRCRQTWLVLLTPVRHNPKMTITKADWTPVVGRKGCHG